MPLLTIEDLPELKQGDRVAFKIIGNDILHVGRIEVNSFGMPCWVADWAYDESGSFLEEYDPFRYYHSLASYGEFTEFNLLGN